MKLALETGAQGYVPKSGSKEELLDAINAALWGKTYVPAEHGAKLNEIANIYQPLSKREKEVLHLLRQGKTNNQIADSINLRKRSVENIVSNIYLKTGAANRKELMDL